MVVMWMVIKYIFTNNYMYNSLFGYFNRLLLCDSTFKGKSVRTARKYISVSNEDKVFYNNYYKEKINASFNDIVNTFYLRLYGVGTIAVALL